MKIKTKYNIGNRVKYIDEDVFDNGSCKCCNSILIEMKNIKLKGTIKNIHIRVQEDNISIDYVINNDFIDEKQIIKKF